MRPPVAGRLGSGRNPATGGAGVWGKRWGKPRGSPRACFGGSEGALGGSAGELGGARRRPPRRREKFRRAGADSGNVQQGRRPRGTREVQWRWDDDRWTGRACSPSSPHGGRRRREAAGGEERVRRGRSSGQPLYGRHAFAPGYHMCPRLNSPYDVSSTGARREPAADRWAT
jgi:hypothetical protein